MSRLSRRPNRPGTNRGDQLTRWLLDSPQQVEFRSLEAGGETYTFPGLEYASVDINQDGQAEHFGSTNGVYWNLYHKHSSVIAVWAPIHNFATPELLVFAPREKQSGVLMCVIVPVAWDK